MVLKIFKSKIIAQQLVGQLPRELKINSPKSHTLFPLYEEVVNSIHSIDERIKNDKEFKIPKAYIKVKIIRSIQRSLDNSKSDITGFEIVDNGIGYPEKYLKPILES